MEELRQKIKDLSDSEKYENYSTFGINSSIIESASLSYHKPIENVSPVELVSVDLFINQDKVNDAFNDDIEREDIKRDNITTVFGYNSKIYKYMFTLLRTVTIMDKTQCKKYLSADNTTSVVHNCVNTKVNLLLKTDIIED